MATQRIKRLEDLITTSIEEPKQRDALYRCMKRGRETRKYRLETLPGGAAFRDDVKATKEKCIADQDALLEKFIANGEKRGIKVVDTRHEVSFCVNIVC